MFCEIRVSPIRISNVPSSSISATAGADQTLFGMPRGEDHPSETSDEVPSSPSKAHKRLPKGTINSAYESPFMSIQIGGETAISSLSFPLPLCISFDHSFIGGSAEISWQPAIPFLLKDTLDSEYQVTQHNRSWIPSSSVSIGNGCESEYPFGVRNSKISSVDVISIATNRAPLPGDLPLASVGMVRIISGAASLSN